MWMPGANNIKGGTPAVSIITSHAFTYLDMELKWKEEQLHFGVHLKQNQLLKYLTQGSMHTKACYRAIPEGVYNRLGKLTTLTEENKHQPVSNVYPTHYNKLQQAGIISGNPPTMLETHNLALHKASEEHKTTKRHQQNRRKRNKEAVGISPYPNTPSWMDHVRGYAVVSCDGTRWHICGTT